VVQTWTHSESFEQTLARARAGDEAAFSALWRWAHPGLLRWQAVVHRDAGEDLASEVRMSVIRNLEAFGGGEREFRAWFFTIARRRAIDLARHRVRRVRTCSFDGVDDLADGQDVAGSTIGDDAVELPSACFAGSIPTRPRSSRCGSSAA
jgi:DNA-directed RNA polymerase specialized sigma24 family protein